MQSGSSRVDVVFVAAHVLTPALNSGGDVLFANIAREAARLRPDWHIAALAPDFACEGLARFFRTVVPLPSPLGEVERVGAHPRNVPLAWRRRVGLTRRALAALRPRLLHATGDFFVDVIPAARAARLTDSRFTGVVHHVNPPPLRRRNSLAASTASWMLQRYSLRTLRDRADRVFLLNADVRANLLRRRFRPEQLVVLGAGIDIERFALAQPPLAPSHVLWVHRLEPTKGIFDLPRLATLMPPGTHIDVVGRGPLRWRERLERELAHSGAASRVTLHGYVDDAELGRLYARAGAFISCSYEEGWGLSLAEALAVGLPCVAYALPSHDEVFGGAVRTVPLGDIASLARAVREELVRQQSFAERLARRAAVEPYSFAAAAGRQVAIFEGLLARER